eukprot:948524-Prymnesium_polylepis.1
MIGARPAASPLLVCAQSRPRDDPGMPRPRGVRAGVVPDRTAPSRCGVRTPKTRAETTSLFFLALTQPFQHLLAVTARNCLQLDTAPGRPTIGLRPENHVTQTTRRIAQHLLVGSTKPCPR